MALEDEARLLAEVLSAPQLAISPERLAAAELALEDVHIPQGAEAMLLKLHAQQKDWRVEMEQNLLRGGTAQAEVQQAKSAVDGVRELAYLMDESLLVEADNLWRDSGVGATSLDAERQRYYDSANPLLAATLLIGDFEYGSESTFGALARKGVLPLVGQGFISLLPISSSSPHSSQLLHFVLSFRQTYLSASRLVVFGSALAQLVQQVFGSLPPPSSTVQVSASYPSSEEELDASLPRGWAAEARHSSTILHRGGQGTGNEGAFDLSSLVSSLPSAAPFASGEVAKPPATTMLVEAVEHPWALMLGSKDEESWEKAVILDHVLNDIVHQHGGHPPSPQASSTSSYFQYLVLSAGEDARDYLVGYPDTSLVGGETPQLLRWVVEAALTSYEGWAEHAKQRGCASFVPSAVSGGDEDSIKGVLEFAVRCRGAFVRVSEAERMEGDEGEGEGGLMIPL
ncbi:hypothetical protein BCR35DRAFT_308908, partial [Leucosporidium creatinivorum]